MILPDDVDEKVEFWVGETDSESEDESESDGETIIGEGSKTCKPAKLVDSRDLRNRPRSEKGGRSTNHSRSGGWVGKRRALGNGLFAVQPDARRSSRNYHTFEVKLETRRMTRSEEGKPTPAIMAVRNPMGKPPRWGTMGGLPTGSEPALSHSLSPTYTQPSASTISLGGHGRRWAMRPPGLGLGLWRDYVSPRLPTSALHPRPTEAPVTSPKICHENTLSPVEDADGSERGADDEREGITLSNRPLPNTVPA